MSTYLKTILAVAITGVMANSAMASDGIINFTGEIIAASCTATAGGGTNITGGTGNQVINVNLGKVTVDSLAGSAGGNIVAGAALNLDLDCGATAAGLKLVKVQFDPKSGSGSDPKNNSLLKTTGTATGVGIGIYDLNSKLLNLEANETFNADLVPLTTGTGADEKTTYSAKLNMRASYVANGDVLTAGTANGTLPFTLTYE